MITVRQAEQAINRISDSLIKKNRLEVIEDLTLLDQFVEEHEKLLNAIKAVAGLLPKDVVDVFGNVTHEKPP